MKLKRFLLALCMALCVGGLVVTFSACSQEHAHDYVTKTLVDATCTEAGLQSHTCACGDVFTDEIPALGHDEKAHDAKSPTAMEIGWDAYVTCEREGCEYSTYQEIPLLRLAFKTLSVDETSVRGTVGNSEETFSFQEEVTAPANLEYVVSLDIDGLQVVENETVALQPGDNTVYLIEKMNGETGKIYTVILRRKPIYTVTFHPNGGEPIESQEVEEGACAIEPDAPTRAGYTFLSWGFDFSTPITKDVSLIVSWSPNHDTPYKICYYLETLESNQFVLVESIDGVGTSGRRVDAEIKEYAHFTYNKLKSNVGDWISGAGDTVLSVYYLRNRYRVSVEDSLAGKVVNGGSYKYGTDPIDVSFVLYLGYEFEGWYAEDTLLSTENSLTFQVEQNVTAKVKLKEEMQNFVFTATESTCKITGVVDSAVQQMVVPSYVTQIEKGAFSKCRTLEDLTIPFVGAEVGKTAEDTFQYPFGYIFGAPPSYIDEDSKTKQTYYGSSVSSAESSYYWIPYSLKRVKVTGGNILRGAFQNCKNLTEIVLPEALTTIYAYAFNACEALVSIEIPSTVETIEQNAFYKCSALVSVTALDNVSSIGSSAFYGCTSLESVYIKDIAAWCNISFKTVYANPLFYASALYVDSKLLTELTLSENATQVGTFAFYRYAPLTKVSIGSGVTAIGNSAFYECDSLKSVTIGNDVTSIGSSAFSTCTALESLTIGNKVESIGFSAFSYCETLTSVIIPDSVTSIGNSAFSGCFALHSVTIGEKLETIGVSAFTNCSALTSVVIPDSVTSIGNSAFANCGALASVVIGRGVQSIGKSAFKEATALSSLVFQNIDGWWYAGEKEATSGTAIESTLLNDSASAITCLTDTYVGYYWRRSV